MSTTTRTLQGREFMPKLTDHILRSQIEVPCFETMIQKIMDLNQYLFTCIIPNTRFYASSCNEISARRL